ncbi:MAG: putative quinol monooxygenase [Planctomycetota bacterium]|jgi:DNA/RNA-binding domain of Phe-tRNA-synthetase-like protein
MNSSAPETVIAIYRVQAEKEAEFFALMRKHHPTLKQLGLVTDKEPVVYRGSEGDGKPIVFEIFDWKDGQAAHVAHETPEVMQVWEAMGTMVEERDGKPKFEFPHVEMVDLSKVAS